MVEVDSEPPWAYYLRYKQTITSKLEVKTMAGSVSPQALNDLMGGKSFNAWGMIGLMGEGLTETRYRRVDDHSKAGYAKLEKDRAADRGVDR